MSDDSELKFLHFCRTCGTHYVTGREAEWTCDACGTLLETWAVEHWDCNGEFEYQEDYADYVARQEG